jgi:hypothetical protein
MIFCQLLCGHFLSTIAFQWDKWASTLLLLSEGKMGKSIGEENVVHENLANLIKTGFNRDVNVLYVLRTIFQDRYCQASTFHEIAFS